MEPLNKRILVKTFLDQKEEIRIKGENGQEIKLWMGKRYVENNRVKNPVICEVIKNHSEYKYILPGDMLLVHHNYVSEPDTNLYCIEYDRQQQIGVFSIPATRNIYCKLNPDGSVEPICHNLIVEREFEPIKTSFIIVPDSVKPEYNDKAKVLKVAPEVEGINPGDHIIHLKMADYEICYTWGGNEYTAIKIWDEEVIGILN